MKNFNHNFSELLLLANEKITFQDENNFSFQLTPMTVKDLYFNNDLIWFLGLLEKEIDELEKSFPLTEITSHYNFITIILTLAEKNKGLKDLANSIINGLKIIVPEIYFEAKQLKIKDISVNEKLFNQIIEVVYKILGKEKIVINPDDDEFTRKEKEIKLRAQRIKAKGKKVGEGKGVKIEDWFAALIYEFPQYKIEDIFNLNIYTFHYLFKYVGKIANYEVSKIAAGNGLTKKHKYFIEK